MALFLDTKSLYYDDVNLIALPNSYLKSRKEVPEEKWRIFVSPMPAIVGETFARQALNLGLSVVLHRFNSIEENVSLFKKLKDTADHSNLWGAIGLEDEGSRLDALWKVGCRNFVIDVANGYLQSVVDYTKRVHGYLNVANFEAELMVGNIHSKEGIQLYRRLSNLYLRVGVGNGCACETATKATGFGRGQITELDECRKEISRTVTPLFICADGGIRNAACAAKAFGLGSDTIMMGSYFSLAEEAQNVIDGEYKFWGCASTYNQKKFGEVRRHSEGKVIDLDKNGIRPLKDLVDDLWGGISSAVSYGGHSTLTEFIGDGVFEIKHSK